MSHIEATNIKAAATHTLSNEETAIVYRLAGPGTKVTAKVEEKWSIEVSDPGKT